MKISYLVIFSLTTVFYWPIQVFAEPIPDGFDDFGQDTESVNEGSLVFPEKLPDHPVHYLHNRIMISGESLKTGWVHLSQCHEHLDLVSAAQIVFHPQRIRYLKITETRNIGSAWVEGPNVQLKAVSKSAKICIDAETRAFSHEKGNRYKLKNGPFMRRFLDGFYPMRLRLDVTLPDENWQLLTVSPNPQRGFRLHQEDDKVSIETLFEGKLFTELIFSQRETKSE